MSFEKISFGEVSRLQLGAAKGDLFPDSPFPGRPELAQQGRWRPPGAGAMRGGQALPAADGGGPPRVDVGMDVSVDVIAPVIVAALVNGNDTVGVIDTVDSKHPGMEAVDRKRSGDESVRELIDAEFYARGIEMLERDWRS